MNFNADIYIKDEGYASVRLHNNLPAMKWCHVMGYQNSLIKFGKEYCGRPVYYPGMNSGMYSFALNESQARAFTKKAKKAGFIVESEF